MTTRAPPRRAPPRILDQNPSRNLDQNPPRVVVSPEEDLETWISKRVRNAVLKRMFQLEIDQGLVDEEEVLRYPDVDIASIQEGIRETKVEIEAYTMEYGESFQNALSEAVRSKNYSMDFFLWAADMRDALENYKNKEIVYLRKRTTAFTLEKPCPNCGKKELIAEAAVFTRAADEAVDQFATCKNCSARYRLQSVL